MVYTMCDQCTVSLINMRRGVHHSDRLFLYHRTSGTRILVPGRDPHRSCLNTTGQYPLGLRIQMHSITQLGGEEYLKNTNSSTVHDEMSVFTIITLKAGVLTQRERRVVAHLDALQFKLSQVDALW